MKKSYKLKLIFIIVLYSLQNVYGQYDQVAKDILDRVAEKTKTYTSIKASFKNSLINEVEDFSETFEGIIYLKDKNYKLEFMETETFFNGKTKWVYIKDSEEVNIMNVEEGDGDVENEILNDPTKIFTIYQDDFKYMFLEEKKMDEKTVNVVDLIPESLEKSYSRIRLFIDKDKDQLYSIKYFSKDGNNYVFTINDYEINLDLDDDFFIFNESKHPDVEVIDLRE